MRENEEWGELINSKLSFGFIKSQETMEAIWVCFCDWWWYGWWDKNDTQIKKWAIINGTKLYPGPLEDLTPKEKEEKGINAKNNRRKWKWSYFAW